MSAFVVDDSTINKIVAAVRNDSHMTLQFELLGYLPKTQPEKLAAALFDMNCDGVDQRYEDKPARTDFHPEPFTFRRVLPPTNVPTYKAVSCLLYQCSEGDVDTTPLYGALESCKEYLAGEIISSLPEYESAPWG